MRKTSNYRIMKEFYGEITEVFTSTRKRDIESMLSRLIRSYKREGLDVIMKNIGYYAIPARNVEYWITKG